MEDSLLKQLNIKPDGRYLARKYAEFAGTTSFRTAD
jgi:hypothetical protein